MIKVSIITRNLREAETYEDFREAWFHPVGFGTTNKMMTMISVAIPRLVIVVGPTSFSSLEEAIFPIAIDAKERQEHSRRDH
jgi:hypothetical protein